MPLYLTPFCLGYPTAGGMNFDTSKLVIHRLTNKNSQHLDMGYLIPEKFQFLIGSFSIDWSLAMANQ
jgi:hypothetical protein